MARKRKSRNGGGCVPRDQWDATHRPLGKKTLRRVAEYKARVTKAEGDTVSKKTKNLIEYGGPHPEPGQAPQYTRANGGPARRKAQESLLGQFYLDAAIGKMYKRPASLGAYADGVYVDASVRNHVVYLGFAVVSGERMTFLSTTGSSPPPRTDLAEREAVWIARQLWPEAIVFCDYRDACVEGATYVPRARNTQAHQAARSRKGFVARDSLSCGAWPFAL